MAVCHRVLLRLLLALAVSACGSSEGLHSQQASGRASEGRGVFGEWQPVASPAARAEAEGWVAGPVEPPPANCNDEGGIEWCEGAHDDDCDGVIDEGCPDCANSPCVRYEISQEEMRGASRRDGPGECVGHFYCGTVDGYASTQPPGGCGDFHCATLRYADGTARPYYCSVYGRCVDGEFIAKGFSW